MSEIRLSLIMPSYNVEKYIEKNIQSVLEIKIQECEFLYVNDGSTDATRSMIESYQKKDSRIRLIDKANAGLGAARNTGLDLCQGKYVYFIDSDDTINAAEIEQSLIIAEKNNLDILKGRHRNVDQDDKVLFEPARDEREFTEQIWNGRDWLLGPRIYDIVCADMFRVEYLREQGFRFAEGVIHEDVDFVISVLYPAERIMLSGLCVYNYYMRSGSIMHSYTPRHYLDTYKAAKRIEQFVENNVSEDRVIASAFTPYICDLYYAIPHLAIQNGITLKSIMKNNDLRSDILNWTGKSKSLKIRIQYVSIKLKIYKCYSFFYKIYNCLRKKA